MLRSNIHSERLISEVKKRPALYDGRNSDPNLRKANWEEVAKDVFREVWETSSGTEKEALVKEVQVKWKSFRDAYNRIKKQEKEDQLKGITKPRKKYIFYDQLSFLDPVIKSYSPNTIFLQDHKERNDDSMDNTYMSSENSNLFKTDQELYEPHTSAVGNSLEESSPLEQRESEERLASILKELIKMQKEDRDDDRMGNKKFLLSLLPFMEKLPDDVNLEVRLQLMSILQTYSNGESFLKV